MWPDGVKRPRNIYAHDREPGGVGCPGQSGNSRRKGPTGRGEASRIRANKSRTSGQTPEARLFPVCGGAVVKRGNGRKRESKKTTFKAKCQSKIKKNPSKSNDFDGFWSEWRDLNPRPLGPEPSALPTALHPENDSLHTEKTYTPIQLFHYKQKCELCQGSIHIIPHIPLSIVTWGRGAS